MDQAAYLHLLRDRRARFHAALDEVGLSVESDADMRSVVGGGWTLGEHLDDTERMELTMAAAFYSMVVRVLHTLQIDVEPEYQPYLDRHPLPEGPSSGESPTR